MTTLILAHKRIPHIGRLLFGNSFSIGDVFGDLNKRGIITYVFGAVLTVFVASYIISMYLVFQSSFALHAITNSVSTLQDAIVFQEAQLQDRKANLLTTHPLLLQSMDVVSSVKYLEPKSFTASAMSIR